jgi:hypothetical protein
LQLILDEWNLSKNLQINNAVVLTESLQAAIGWTGDISREESEQLLRGTPLGTFLMRWSFNVRSYVLSYRGEGGYFHIRDILPYEGKIKVIKEDNRVLCFETLVDYVNSMKKQNIITNPLDLRTYAKSPYSIANPAQVAQTT